MVRAEGGSWKAAGWEGGARWRGCTQNGSRQKAANSSRPRISTQNNPGSRDQGWTLRDGQCFGAKQAVPIFIPSLGGCTLAYSGTSIPVPSQQRGTWALLRPSCFGSDSNCCHGTSSQIKRRLASTHRQGPACRARSFSAEVTSSAVPAPACPSPVLGGAGTEGRRAGGCTQLPPNQGRKGEGRKRDQS